MNIPDINPEFLKDKTLYVIQDSVVWIKCVWTEQIFQAFLLLSTLDMNFQAVDILSRFQMWQKSVWLVGNPWEWDWVMMSDAKVCNVDGHLNIWDVVAATESDIAKIMVKPN